MEHLTVTILDREYRLACTPDERDALLKSAAYVDSKMQAIRSGGKVMGADRVAVMAALQITHELFSARSADGVDLGELRRRVRDLLHTACGARAKVVSSLNRCALRKVAGLASRCDRHAFAEPKRRGQRPP